jgi:ubiquinone/menaquinone biosynthesis C-methylase UbiE
VASSPASRWRAYRDVDGARDPSMLSHQLDGIAATPAMAASKRRSLELLGLTAGGSVLDVGCGNGPELAALAQIVGPTGRVVGLDRSSALIADAQARGLLESGPIELLVGDAEALPFEDGQFDACRIDRTLQHLDHPEVALSEMRRVTRAGGTVVASESRWGLVGPKLDRNVVDGVFQAVGTTEGNASWFGYLLPVIFRFADLSEVCSERAEALLTDYDELARFTNLSVCMDDAVREGVLSADQVGEWENTLREQVSRGDAYVGIEVVHIVGRRTE